MRVIGLCALLSLAAMAPAVIVIDSFGDTQAKLMDDEDADGTASRILTPAAVGGSRTLGVRKGVGPAGSVTSTRIRQGWYGANDFGTTGLAYTAYFSTGANATTGAVTFSASRNENLSAMSEFMFSMLGNDLPVTLRVTMIDARFDPALQLRNRVWQRTVAAGGARIETLTVADIVQDDAGFDVTRVDSLQLGVIGTASADWGISRVEAVPEPATLAALGLGALAVAGRRRRK